MSYAQTPPGFPPLNSIINQTAGELESLYTPRQPPPHEAEEVEIFTPPAPPPASRVPPVITNITAEKRRAAVSSCEPSRCRKPKAPSSGQLQDESAISPDKFSLTTPPSTRPQKKSLDFSVGQNPVDAARGSLTYVGHNPVDTTRASLSFVGRNPVDNTARASVSQDEDLTRILDAIKEKYGDIAKNCSLESDRSRSHYLIGICKVVQDLQKTHFKDVDVSMLDSYYKDIRDAEKLCFNVLWLRKRLDEIKDAIRARDQVKSLTAEVKRREENMYGKKKEIVSEKVLHSKLRSETRVLENQLLLKKREEDKVGYRILRMEDEQDNEARMVTELNENTRKQESLFSHFEQCSWVMDGII